MKFEEYGDRQNPVMVMLPGAFCPGESLAYLYETLQKEYNIIVPEYSGQYESASYSEFSTAKEEAAKIVLFLKERGIAKVAMIYGQSVGAGIGIELLRQLAGTEIVVHRAFFDAAACKRGAKYVSLSLFYLVRRFVNLIRRKPTDRLLKKKCIHMLTNGDPESLRHVLEGIRKVVPVLSEETMRKETAAIFSYEFPVLMENLQRRLYFFYGRKDVACRLFRKSVEKAYPFAQLQVLDGYGYLNFSVRRTEDYIAMMKRIMELGEE